MRHIVNLRDGPNDGLRGITAMLCRDIDMQNDPFQQALGHLEEAIDRLEGVARPSAPDARLAALQARHDRLRGGATAALARLDRLIGGATPRAEDD